VVKVGDSCARFSASIAWDSIRYRRMEGNNDVQGLDEEDGKHAKILMEGMKKKI